jgi:hypothetical protein
MERRIERLEAQHAGLASGGSDALDGYSGMDRPPPAPEGYEHIDVREAAPAPTIEQVYGTSFDYLMWANARQGVHYLVRFINDKPDFRPPLKGEAYISDTIHDVKIAQRDHEIWFPRIILQPDTPSAPTVESVYGKPFEEMEWPKQNYEGATRFVPITEGGLPVFRRPRRDEAYLDDDTVTDPAVVNLQAPGSPRLIPTRYRRLDPETGQS